MKKLVLVFTMVVLLAAAVFGGQAIASNKPADVTVSEETSAIWGSSYWGSPLRIKTLSGTATIIDEIEAVILEETYSGARHVSISLYVSGLDDLGDELMVAPYVSIIGAQVPVIWTTTDGYEQYDFNADEWRLTITDNGNNPVRVQYWVTITYPSNQW